MKVRVTFTLEPDDPDPEDLTGMTEEEYNRLTDQLMQMGAEEFKVERVGAEE